jgi:hypothetical protein
VVIVVAAAYLLQVEVYVRLTLEILREEPPL